MQPSAPASHNTHWIPMDHDPYLECGAQSGIMLPQDFPETPTEVATNLAGRVKALATDDTQE